VWFAKLAHVNGAFFLVDSAFGYADSAERCALRLRPQRHRGQVGSSARLLWHCGGASAIEVFDRRHLLVALLKSVVGANSANWRS
jgi:hypothetical protein